MPAAPKLALIFALSAALGCTPVVEFGSEGAPAQLAVDAGTSGAADASQADASGVDASQIDDAGADAGQADAAQPDAGAQDAGTQDAGTQDAGTQDAGTQDAGAQDAGTQDTGTQDAGTQDAGTQDAGTQDAGTQDAGTQDAGTLPNPVPVALLGAHCSSGATGLRLTLASAGSTCAEVAALVGGDSPSDSFINAALNSSGSQTITTTGQYCDGSCRELPVTIRVTAHPSGGAATGSYSFTENGSIIAEGDFSTSSCAYDTVGASAQLVIDRVTISQAVDIPLYHSGAVVSARNAPIIADRAAQLRVFAHGQGGWSAHQLTGRLVVSGAGATQTLSDTLNVGASAGSYNDPDSTFNFDLAAGRIQAGSAVRLELLESDGCPAAVSNKAGLGSFSLDAQEALSMKVVLVPVTYQGTALQVSATRVENYRMKMLTNYPVSATNFTVTLSDTPLVWNDTVSETTQSTWESLLAAVQSRRTADDVSGDTFYFALLHPGDDFCSSGCIAGIAPLNYSNAPSSQVGVGLYHATFPGDVFVHEIGHSLGRRHTSCSNGDPPDDQDASYPYAGGKIGVWGTEISDSATTLHPDTAPDFMGYCDDDWISDYTYEAIYTALQQVHSRISSSRASFALPISWLRISQIGATLSLREPIKLREEPGGEAVAVSYLDADGVTIEEATAYRTLIADLPDSSSFILPLAPEGAVAVQLDGYGQLAL